LAQVRMEASHAVLYEITGIRQRIGRTQGPFTAVPLPRSVEAFDKRQNRTFRQWVSLKVVYLVALRKSAIRGGR
jgi:hypothetical protein